MVFALAAVAEKIPKVIAAAAITSLPALNATYPSLHLNCKPYAYSNHSPFRVNLYFLDRSTENIWKRLLHDWPEAP